MTLTKAIECTGEGTYRSPLNVRLVLTYVPEQWTDAKSEIETQDFVLTVLGVVSARRSRFPDGFRVHLWSVDRPLPASLQNQKNKHLREAFVEKAVQALSEGLERPVRSMAWGNFLNRADEGRHG